MTAKNWLALIVAVVLCNFAGIIGALFTQPQIDGWYAQLVQPELAPPNWVFGPVWTTLYILMGIAAWLVWRQRAASPAANLGLSLFGLQLVLNTLWSLIFFGQHRIDWALVEILLLWLAILATMLVFSKVSRAAVWLLVPYLAWVSFATYLNYMFWRLNP